MLLLTNVTPKNLIKKRIYLDANNMSLSLKWRQVQMPNTKNFLLSFLHINLHSNSFPLIFLILEYSTTDHLNHPFLHNPYVFSCLT